MDKIKAILPWGSLIILFIIMIFIEKNQVEKEVADRDDDEVIYLSSYEPAPEIEIIPEPKAMILDAPIITAQPTIADIGRLAVTSVIINKKTLTQHPSQAEPIVEENKFNDPDFQFLQTAGNSPVEASQAHQQQDLAYKIFQGQRFSAVLTHAINSDLRGMVVAEVSQDIYGYQSRIPLLPKGTRLIGLYNSRLNVGDTRLFIVWQRAITPTGIDIPLGSIGTDRLGQTGLSGFVDEHFWETFGTSSLLSVMAVGASNLSEQQGEFSNQYQQGVTEAFMDSSRTILSSRIQRKPTIHIAQGEIIHVMAAKDLDFSVLKSSADSIAIF
jgi:type IV secretory pathway VirB10-like protein